MKSLKNILIYILSMIFLLSLTASFEGEKIIDHNLMGLDLSSDQMKLAFYDKYSLMDQMDTEGPDREGEQYVMGNSGDVIFYYQRVLRMLGHMDKEPDGNFDQTTKDAVVAYQREKGLESNGTLDYATLDQLDLEEPGYTTGQQGEEILQYQEILYYLDYLEEKPQGTYDVATTTAVRSYQQDKGLAETGILDMETMDTLYREPITYGPEKEGEPIQLLQEKLIYLEYLFGTADGKFGSMTTDAVTRFQQDQDLEQTGLLDPDTVEVLNRLVEVTP